MDKNVIFINDIEKEDLELNMDNSENWKNDIYGFECANWTCKC